MWRRTVQNSEDEGRERGTGKMGIGVEEYEHSLVYFFTFFVVCAFNSFFIIKRLFFTLVPQELEAMDI
jgi:hypothetical protein